MNEWVNATCNTHLLRKFELSFVDVHSLINIRSRPTSPIQYFTHERIVVSQRHDVKMAMKKLHRSHHLRFLGNVERIPPTGAVGIAALIPQAVKVV